MLRYSVHSAFSEPAYIQAFLVDKVNMVVLTLLVYIKTYQASKIHAPLGQQEKLVYMLVQKRPSAVPCAFASYARPFLRSMTQVSHIQLRDLPLESLSSSNCCAISTGSLCCASAVLQISSISFLRLLYAFLSLCRQLHPCRSFRTTTDGFPPRPSCHSHQISSTVVAVRSMISWGTSLALF